MEEFSFDAISSTANQVGDGFLSFLSVVEVIGYILIVGFIAGIIYCIIALSEIKAKSKETFENHFIQAQPQQANPRMEHWKKVSDAMASNNEQLWRSALIDADTMLEEVVTAMGAIGDTFGEKLKSMGRQVPWIDAAWEVHRLRNILAHEGGRYPLNQREAYRAYKIYESILYETGYLS
jgi:hypothetical protein